MLLLRRRREVGLVNWGKRASDTLARSLALWQAAPPCSLAPQVFFDYLQRGYDLFLSGEDDLSQLDDELRFSFDAKNSQLRSDIDALEKANAELAAKHAALAVKPSPLEESQSANQLLISDTEKMKTHIAKLEEHRGKVSGKLQQESERSQKAQDELRQTLAAVDAHKATIAQQELTPSDVERMNANRDSLEQELSRVKSELNDYNQQLWERETSISRGLEALEAKAQSANMCAQRLLLIPAEAKNAGGVSHQIDVQKELLETESWRLLSVDPTAVIKPSLVQLKDQFLREWQQQQDAKIEAEDAAQKRDEEKQERTEELHRLKEIMQQQELEEKRVRATPRPHTH